MEAIMELIPVRQVETKIQPYREVIDVQDVQFVESNTMKGHSKQFIEANTREATLQHLKNDCMIPVFSKDNELTISHVNFIETVYDAASKIFPRERINVPEIRVSHVIKGRTPEAAHKAVHELLDADKTI
jgi:hypothetical protein